MATPRILPVTLQGEGREADVLDIELDHLPSVDDLLPILQQERVALPAWRTLAIEYHRQGHEEAFERLMREATSDAMALRSDRRDLVAAWSSMGAYCVQRALRAASREDRRKYRDEATKWYNRVSAASLDLADQNHVMGMGLIRFIDAQDAGASAAAAATALSDARQFFRQALESNPTAVPAMQGLALVALHGGDYAAALRHYRAVLELSPPSPATASVRLAIGFCLAKLGRLEEARQAFERTLELSPHDIEAVVALAVLDLNDGAADSVQRAMRRLTEAYRIAPRHSMVLCYLSNHFFYKGEYGKALALAHNAYAGTEEAHPRSLAAYMLARTYHAQRDYDKAFQYYYQAARLDAKLALAQLGLGQMFIQRSKHADAIQCCEKVLDLQPDNYETLRILASLYASGSDPAQHQRAVQNLRRVTKAQADDVEAWLELASLLEASDYESAEHAYFTAAELLRNNAKMEVPADILNNIGVVRLRMGLVEKARRAFDAALVQASDAMQGETAEEENADVSLQRVTMMYNRAILHEVEHETSKAESLYSKILEEHPAYVDCYLRLGCLARDRGHISTAMRYLKEALHVERDNADATCLLANIYASLKKWRHVQESLEALLERPQHRDDAYIMLTLGNMYHECADLDAPDRGALHLARARSVYLNVLRMDARNIYAANGIGGVLAEQGHLGAARDIFLQVREATSDAADVFTNLAMVHQAQGSYEAAVHMYNRCLRSFGAVPNVHLLVRLAWCHYEAGHYRECRTVLQRALRISPDDLSLRFNLALAMARGAAVAVKAVNAADRHAEGAPPALPSAADIRRAIADLEHAHRLFSALAKAKDARSRVGLRRHNPTRAASEAERCTALLGPSRKALRATEQNASRLAEEEMQRKRMMEDARMRKLAERRQLELDEEKSRQAAEDARKKFKEERSEALRVVAKDTSHGKRARGGGRRRRRRAKEAGEDEGEDQEDEDEDEGEDEGEGGKGARRRKRVKEEELVDEADLTSEDSASDTGDNAAAAAAAAATSGELHMSELFGSDDDDDDAEAAAMDVERGARRRVIADEEEEAG